MASILLRSYQEVSNLRYEKIVGVSNESFRTDWTRQQIAKAISTSKGAVDILDVGAGSSPYKSFIEDLGGNYFSHDFSQYIPSSLEPGIQNKSWEYPEHTYVCDILNLEPNRTFDVVICTEVLEHVPNPNAAFSIISGLVQSGGTLIVTVPFLSLMHQSPFFYNAGLSPYWFISSSEKAGLERIELLVSGDYVDFMTQEIYRLISQVEFSGFSRLARFSKIIQKSRRLLPQSLLDAGAFGTFYVGRAK